MTLFGAVTKKEAKYWAPALEILLLSIALHAVLVFMFKPVEKETGSSDRNKRYTVVCSQEDLMNDVYGLKHWLKYDDPKVFTSPDEKRGYSIIRTLFEHDSFGEDVVASDDELVILQKRKRFPADITKRALSAYDIDMKIPAVSGFNLKHDIPPPEKANGNGVYPMWIDSSGRSLGNLSKGDIFVERILAKKSSKESTVLSVSVTSADMPPEIRVMESCGNFDLDIAAVRNLSSFLAKNTLTHGAFKSAGRSAIYSVMWSPVKDIK